MAEIQGFIDAVCPGIDDWKKEKLVEFAEDDLDNLICDYENEMGASRYADPIEELILCAYLKGLDVEH